MEKFKAILKVKANKLKYNYKLFITFVIMEDDKLVKLIKNAYQTDECVMKILQLLIKDFI